MAMKRYVVFIFADHYPAGGSGDVEGSFDSFEEAWFFGRKDNAGGLRNVEILDREDGIWIDGLTGERSDGKTQDLPKS